MHDSTDPEIIRRRVEQQYKHRAILLLQTGVFLLMNVGVFFLSRPLFFSRLWLGFIGVWVLAMMFYGIWRGFVEAREHAVQSALDRARQRDTQQTIRPGARLILSDDGELIELSVPPPASRKRKREE